MSTLARSSAALRNWVAPADETAELSRLEARLQFNARLLQVVTVKSQFLKTITGRRKRYSEACIALPIERGQRGWRFRSGLCARWRRQHKKCC
jgi:hypothetical protein